MIMKYKYSTTVGDQKGLWAKGLLVSYSSSPRLRGPEGTLGKGTGTACYVMV